VYWLHERAYLHGSIVWAFTLAKSAATRRNMAVIASVICGVAPATKQATMFQQPFSTQVDSPYSKYFAASYLENRFLVSA
jgi:hypothetical protein